jgi:transposase
MSGACAVISPIDQQHAGLTAALLHDAEAISDAASRPTMRSVVVKTVDQQADGIILKHREMLVGQRTQAINALRGHAAEFGVVAAKGLVKVAPLLAVLAADGAIPTTARAMFAQMGAHIEALDQRVAAVDGELAVLHKANPVSQRLAAIPGVGPLGAITLALTVDPRNFTSGRHFAAWLGTEGTIHQRQAAHGRASTRGREDQQGRQ